MSEDTFFQSTRLENGLLVVTEHVPGVRSISCGIWIKAGSRDETPAQAGITHFLEHLIFKGTATRSARAIAEAFDAIGGELNAFSAKEYTCVYGRMIDEHADTGLDILSDLVLNPVFRPEDIEAERPVVLEEINMHEDAPAELIHDLFDQHIYHGHPLGPRILGKEKTIAAMGRKDIFDYWKAGYSPANIVVAAAGNVGHNKFVDQIESLFGAARGPKHVRRARKHTVRPQSVVQKKDTQQAHIVYGLKGISVKDEDRYVLSVVDVILGGGMSSRLFQKIREKRGLVYSVYSYRGQYSETGSLAVYAGTSPDKCETVLDLISREFDSLARKGVTAKELARAKEQLKGNIVLSMEDTTTRMNRLGRSSVYESEILSMDELISKVDAITKEDTARVSARIFSGERVLTVIGPFEKEAFDGYVKGNG